MTALRGVSSSSNPRGTIQRTLESAKTVMTAARGSGGWFQPLVIPGVIFEVALFFHEDSGEPDGVSARMECHQAALLPMIRVNQPFVSGFDAWSGTLLSGNSRRPAHLISLIPKRGVSSTNRTVQLQKASARLTCLPVSPLLVVSSPHTPTPNISPSPLQQALPSR